MEQAKVDPVCGMSVDPIGAITGEFEGRTFSFCEPVCLETFDDEPERWADGSPVHDHPIEAAVVNAAS